MDDLRVANQLMF